MILNYFFYWGIYVLIDELRQIVTLVLPSRKDIPLLHWPSSFQPSCVFPISLSSFLKSCLFPATLSQIMGDDKGFYYSHHGSQHKFHVYIFFLWPQVPGGWWIATPSQTLYRQWGNENLGNPNLKKWLLENLYNFCTEGDITFIFPSQQTNLSSAPDWTTLATVQLFTI